MSFLGLPDELIERISQCVLIEMHAKDFGEVLMHTCKRLLPFGVSYFYATADFISGVETQSRFRIFCNTLKHRPTYAEAVLELSFMFRISNLTDKVASGGQSQSSDLVSLWLSEKYNPVFPRRLPNCRRLSVHWSRSYLVYLPPWKVFMERMHLFPRLETLAVENICDSFIDLDLRIDPYKSFPLEQRVELILWEYHARNEHAAAFWASCIPWASELVMPLRSNATNGPPITLFGVHDLNSIIKTLSFFQDNDKDFFDIRDDMALWQNTLCNSLSNVTELRYLCSSFVAEHLEKAHRLKILTLRIGTPNVSLKISRFQAALQLWKYPTMKRLTFQIGSRSLNPLNSPNMSQQELEEEVEQALDLGIRSWCRKHAVDLAVRYYAAV